MKVLKILILCQLVMTSGIVCAQTNFFPGYYVSPNADTVRGFIDFRSDGQLHKSFLFKASPNAKRMRLFPVEVNSFVIANKVFFETQTYTSGRGGTVRGFFKLVAQGRLSLFRYHDRYFIRNSQGLIMEITKSSKAVVVNDGETDHTGLGALRSQTVDCHSLNQARVDIAYTGNPNYKKLVGEYNDCMGGNIALEDPDVRYHVTSGVLLSGTQSALSFQTPVEITGADFSDMTHFSGGVFASVFIPRMGDNIRVVVEATYGRTNHYTYFENANGTNDIFLRFSYLKMPVMLRFSTRSLFADVGISNMFMLHQNTDWRIEERGNDVVYTRHGPSFKLNGWTPGLAVGVGGKIRISGVDLLPSIRFVQSAPSNRSDYPTLQSYEVSIAFGLFRKQVK